MADQPLSKLGEAVARNTAISLALPSAGMARHHKSRFLKMTETELWVESVPSESTLLDEILNSAQPVVVDFKAGDSNLTFSARVRGRERDYRLNVNENVTLEALRLEFPSEIKTVQRRTHYRVKTRADSLSAQVWRIARGAQAGVKLSSQQELLTEVRDLSLGGIGVLFQPKAGQPPKVVNGESVRVELRSAGGTLLLDGLVRCVIPAGDGGGVRAGIQFTAAERTLEGRQTLSQLTKILAGIEREELRRVRLGLAG